MLFLPCGRRMALSSHVPKCQSIRLISKNFSTKGKKTGAGFGNVYDHMLPSGRAKLFQHCKSPRTVSIIGAPMTYGQPFVGTDYGPSLLREAGLRSMLSSLGWRVEDNPDLDFDELYRSDLASTTMPSARNCGIIGQATSQIADMVQSKIEDGHFPLVMGGDHSIGMGTLAGILRVRPNTGVLWIDAHADLNTPQTSSSGNMHGMPIGLVMDGIMSPEDKSNIPGLEWMAANHPTLPPDSIVYVGLRDVDPPERELIRQHNILAFTMHDIDRHGIGNVMEMAIQHLLKNDPNRPLHISYDIDAVDPVLAPATGTTVRGGLTFREAHYVAEAAAESGNLASAEIVELNPNLSDEDGAKETVELGLQLITSFMGKGII